ncbi:hypothetical protein [Aliarcobacter butzleri]|uniref:hypothetical protein n=1 Tax=Aliarcobacter butzleri TaxID=28197 RepID=UPI0021B65346|nr:hypothetical protein [Aliarcobacter butzleri]MCT7570536.1 hypothetical protein [Aliarcobacter butzleri]
MNKKIFLVLLLLSNILNASSCKFYEERMVYYSNKIDQLAKNNRTEYCEIADNTELLVNNIGGAIASCSDGYKLKPILETYTNLLMASSLKCGK